MGSIPSYLSMSSSVSTMLMSHPQQSCFLSQTFSECRSPFSCLSPSKSLQQLHVKKCWMASWLNGQLAWEWLSPSSIIRRHTSYLRSLTVLAVKLLRSDLLLLLLFTCYLPLIASIVIRWLCSVKNGTWACSTGYARWC